MCGKEWLVGERRRINFDQGKGGGKGGHTKKTFFGGGEKRKGSIWGLGKKKIHVWWWWNAQKRGENEGGFFALPATAFPYNPKAKNRELGDDNRMCLSKPQRVISTWIYF